jgi:hypothetical protein
MSLNQYTQLLYYIKQLADADEYINTVTNSPDDSIDLDKGNVFPLLNVDIVSGSFTNGQTVKFNVEIVCLDIRDINKEIRTDKFWGQDNEVDNYNDTLAALNRLWTSMYRDFEDNNITANENPQLEIITYSNVNLLDGWKLTFEVEMPNTTLNLCT